MAYRRCAECGINFPTNDEFRDCLACGDPTNYSAVGLPDNNWPQRAEAIATRIASIEAGKLAPITHVDSKVYVDEEGLMWVSSHDAIRAGVLDLHLADVITVGPPLNDSASTPDENIYEVIAYVNDRRAYWVRPLLVPDHA